MTAFLFAGSVVYIGLKSTFCKAAALRADQLCNLRGKRGVFVSGGWQSISEGKDVFYYSCHTAESSESTPFTCLPRTGLTSQALNQDLQDGAAAGWVRGCSCRCRSGESGPAATLSPAGSSSPSRRWHSVSPHQPALPQTAPGMAGSQLALGSAVHR